MFDVGTNMRKAGRRMRAVMHYTPSRSLPSGLFGRCGMMRASFLPLSPLLLLAAALVALTVFFAPGPQPASGQMTNVEVWSATLTVADLTGEHGDGCDSFMSQEELHCVPGQLLTNNSFKYMGTEDRIVGARVLYGNLRLTFYSPIDEFYLKTLTLHVDGRRTPCPTGPSGDTPWPESTGEQSGSTPVSIGHPATRWT